jgi:SAM-dependent methyltransferase
MPEHDTFRERARAMWASGDWDGISRIVVPVGTLVLERIALEPGMDLLDVGTGSGGTIAIPAALAGARVVGSDITPELFVHARRRAAEAGVEVEWVEADAQNLPFADASFDRVTSTFGAMFAPDHRRAAAELVRVCRPGGLVAMATWLAAGFPGELFKLTGAFLPPPPAGVQAPPLWGVEAHVTETFAAAGASPTITRELVIFEWPSVAEAVRDYTEDFGPFVAARALLEPQGRWPEFVQEFTALVERFNRASDGDARVEAQYLLITVER